MKIFKLMVIALVAMIGLNSCSEDCDHDFIEVDHSKDLVGTWTCLQADYAEALVINADGSVVSTGVKNGEYWEDVKGKIKTIKKSVSNPVYKDIDIWTFQDQDNTQMHMYMPTYAFENFLANTAVEMMAQNGGLDLNDTNAVAAIFNGVENAIETINVSFIFKATK